MKRLIRNYLLELGASIDRTNGRSVLNGLCCLFFYKPKANGLSKITTRNLQSTEVSRLVKMPSWTSFSASGRCARTALSLSSN
ncbi:hypothetical protein PGT21_009534 [Puccinia graminis f. sp. tritici]|uniref:Uncharacterized protein n=1 Tax=Puccinia graminis f. sp. tritici TaxID=56615 RepID=A0A5B0PK63_PUCGR|nr:hypothetical protein PGT21_009534 [Puccinia graminis f. sp. tritici]